MDIRHGAALLAFAIAAFFMYRQWQDNKNVERLLQPVPAGWKYVVARGGGKLGARYYHMAAHPSDVALVTAQVMKGCNAAGHGDCEIFKIGTK